MKRILLIFMTLIPMLFIACANPDTLPNASTSPPGLADPVSQLSYSDQKVELNYAMHESVTYQQIKDSITTAFDKDIENELDADMPVNSREYRLKDITIDNHNINVFLELHFQPYSKAWLIKDAYSWLGLASCVGLDVNHKFAANPYSTGYDISIIVSTPLVDGRVISWGIAKIKNSGKAFDDNTLIKERIWIDGPGMKTLN